MLHSPLSQRLRTDILEPVGPFSPLPEVSSMRSNDGLSAEQLRLTLAYIQSRLDQPIRLAEIAVELGISQSYFCRLFRQSMRVPPYQYVLQQRVERAKRMLRTDQDMAIADIALACGFSNQSNLTRHFRQVTGTTPKLYRKRMSG